MDQVTATDIVALPLPIWLEKAETASRVRQRIARILDGATVKDHRTGDNPARLKGNLEFLLPRKTKGETGHHEAIRVGVSRSPKTPWVNLVRRAT